MIVHAQEHNKPAYGTSEPLPHQVQVPALRGVFPLQVKRVRDSMSSC